MSKRKVNAPAFTISDQTSAPQPATSHPSGQALVRARPPDPPPRPRRPRVSPASRYSSAGLANLPAIVYKNNMAGRLDGGQPAYIPSPDWSRNLIDYEDAIPHTVSIFTDGTGATPNAVRQPGTLSGPVQLGKNFEKKVRKHIDQVRNRVTPPEDIPSPGKGGIKLVAEIIHERVAKGGGREATCAGETVVAFEDGGVTYIFRSNGEFWTILGN